MARAAVRGRLTWQVAQVSSVLEEADAVRTIELEVPDWPGHRARPGLDGNAIGGLLQEVFGTDMTNAEAACATCGRDRSGR